MQLLPREVILALVLVDLPVDLHLRGVNKNRDRVGGSWWYVACECDDHYTDVVEEVVSLCSYSQVRELCFLKHPSGDPLISYATPKCAKTLQRALRFVGRYEFVAESDFHVEINSSALKSYDALDFGTKEDGREVGRKVVILCFNSDDGFYRQVRIGCVF
jgi:hypothetical protein